MENNECVGVFENLIIIIACFILAVKMIFCAGRVFLTLTEIDRRTTDVLTGGIGSLADLKKTKKLR